MLFEQVDGTQLAGRLLRDDTHRMTTPLPFKLQARPCLPGGFGSV